MRAFQIRIERMTQERFRKLHFSKKSEDRIYNCEVIHYTRNNPYDDKVAQSQYMSWVRSVRPTADPIWTTGWRNVSRPRYSNDDLLNIISTEKITE